MLKQRLAVTAGIVGLGALLAIPSLAAPKQNRQPSLSTTDVNNATCVMAR